MSDDLILPSDQIRVKTVLVVEDDEDIGAMIVVALSQETPYQAVLATDGLQALEMIRSFAPRLFLLDYRLPGMDGIELYDYLHATKGLESVPALMISANVPMLEMQKRSIIYMKKPFDLGELLQTISKLLM